MSIKKVTLSNGLRVANFNSPHSFTFTDGSILEACEKERALALLLKPKEKISRQEINNVTIDIIDLEFKMTYSVTSALVEICALDDVDIVLVPLPVLQLIRKHSDLPQSVKSKAKGIRVADRITKTIHIDRFCQ